MRSHEFARWRVDSLAQTLLEVCGWLESQRIPYMVIGGWAASTWGEQRTTRDVDVTIWVEEEAMPSFVEKLRARFPSPISNALEFIERHRVLPVRNADGSKIDMIFALLPYEFEAIQRACSVGRFGAKVRMCAPEDLILHKIISDRPQDRRDIEQVVRHRFGELDLGYLEPRIESLVVELGISSIGDRWNELKRKANERASPE